MPEDLTEFTKSTHEKKAIVFVLFDLSRPATFFDTGKETHDVKYLMNEVDTYNLNGKILKFLIGTNADRVGSDFDTQDAEKYAH